MTASFDKHYRLFMESDGDSPVPIDNQVGRERWPSSGSAAEMFKKQQQQATANTKIDQEAVAELGGEIEDMSPEEQKLVLSNLKKFLGATKNTLIFLLKVGNLITTNVRPGAKVLAATSIVNMVRSVNGVLKNFEAMERYGGGNFDLSELKVGDTIAALATLREQPVLSFIVKLNGKGYRIPDELHDNIIQAVTLSNNYEWWSGYLFLSSLVIWITNRSRTLGGKKGFQMNPLAGNNKFRFKINPVKKQKQTLLGRVGRILGGGREGGSG